MTTTMLQLSQALGYEAADKRLDILRRIGAAGSISEAARGAGVSYKAAWQAIETLGNLAGQDLVEKSVGGVGGGGARLTAAGQRLLRAADLIAKARSAVLDRIGEATDDLGVRTLAGLALRTSIRNQLPCAVRSLRRSGAAIRVELALSDGTPLGSRITVESAELLGLHAGLPVIALCKATAVAIADPPPEQSGVNRLSGIVTRAPESSTDREVSLKLASGLQLVGFASAAAHIQVGQLATASVEESAIAIALAG